MAFNGFGSGTLAFLRELAADNSREWFAENRGRYETEVRGPAEAFIVALGSLLSLDYPSLIYDTRRNGSGSLMRVYRDIRFSPDKRPFKENVGIIFPLAPGKKVEVPIFYFHIGLDSSFFYGGRHVFPPASLERYRRAVDDERKGSALKKILTDLESAGLGLMEEPAYKRVPRLYASDHPRAALLRQAALGVGVEFGIEELASPDLVQVCASAAVRMKPLMEWLFAVG